MNRPAALAAFPIIIDLPVQWGEQDAFGHVNNIVYFRWFESARIAYLEQVDLGHNEKTVGIGPILASIKCDYRRQLTYPDTVQIGSRVVKIGRSSFVMEHKIFSLRQQVIVAEGDGTVVAFDYHANRSCPVPEHVRAAIAKLEGRDFGSAAASVQPATP